VWGGRAGTRRAQFGRRAWRSPEGIAVSRVGAETRAWARTTSAVAGGASPCRPVRGMGGAAGVGRQAAVGSRAGHAWHACSPAPASPKSGCRGAAAATPAPYTRWGLATTLEMPAEGQGAAHMVSVGRKKRRLVEQEGVRPSGGILGRLDGAPRARFERAQLQGVGAGDVGSGFGA